MLRKKPTIPADLPLAGAPGFTDRVSTFACSPGNRPSDDGRHAMNRHYYISDNLDEPGTARSRTGSQRHRHRADPRPQRKGRGDRPAPLHEVSVREEGCGPLRRVGCWGPSPAIVAVAFAYASGWTETAAGWIPVIFLGAMLCAFCLGRQLLLGLQRTNRAFRPFEERLHQHPVLRRRTPRSRSWSTWSATTRACRTPAPALRSPLLLGWQQRWRQFRRMV